MFNDSMRGVSVMSYSLLNSVKDMIVRNNVEDMVDDSVQFINENGDIYIPFSERCSPLEQTFPTFYPKDDGSKTFETPMYFQDFKREYIDPNITTVTFDESVPLESFLKQLAEEESVYGVVLQKDSGSFAINPLHPMVAFLISANLLELPKRGKLHIFEWKPSALRYIKDKSEKPSYIEKYIEDYTDFFGLSPQIVKEPVTIKQTASVSDHEVASIIEDPFIENIQTIIQIHKSDTGRTDLGKIKTLAIPHQLIVDGTLSPYYGLSCITKPTNDEIRGFGLGPMVTGNISQCHREGERSFKNFYESGNSSNVCTGSENSILPKGWFTLSRVNLDSMYYSDVISREHVFPFIKASKKVAADIFGVIVEEKKKELEEA